MRIISKILATFFGLGYFPLAPGTLTSLVMVIIYKFFLFKFYKFFLFKLTWPLHLILFFLLFLVGSFVSTNYSAALNKKDPQKVVIDEACGQYLALFQLTPSWLIVGLSFLLFRFFDIIKPFPLKRVELFPHGWGIMLDDIAAGLYAGIITYIFLLVK